MYHERRILNFAPSLVTSPVALPRFHKVYKRIDIASLKVFLEKDLTFKGLEARSQKIELATVLPSEDWERIFANLSVSAQGSKAQDNDT